MLYSEVVVRNGSVDLVGAWALPTLSFCGAIGCRQRWSREESDQPEEGAERPSAVERRCSRDVSEDVRALLSPVVSAAGLELVDVETGPGRIRVVVDCEGGVGIDALAQANRVVSRALDEEDPFPGSYTLEVSSPGLERPLRTPEHFRRAAGSTVSVRTKGLDGSLRRVRGRLASVDDEGFVLEDDELPGGQLELTYSHVDRARTIFEWGPSRGAPRPGGKKKSAESGRPGRPQRVTPSGSDGEERVKTQ